ncbi:hypothetical protein HYT55_05250 [Candidatus Woesearchaeota archaeon]|nr:hypothetical protein [Candidatus Woesearchaeota archaeon]
MLNLNDLSNVDQAAAYIRDNSNLFVQKRLEQLLEGESVSGLFQKKIAGLVQTSSPAALEQRIDDYLPDFIRSVLLPFVRVCGFQLQTAPESDVSVYTVFGQWWGASAEMRKDEVEDKEPISFTFSDVMKLLRGGLDYHPTSIELYMTIAHNYYQEMEAASARREWPRVLTYAQVGDYHLQKALQINPQFEPRSVDALLRGEEYTAEYGL